MAVTYKAISTTTVPATPASSIVFNAIPNSYTDLLLVFSLRTDTGNITIGQQNFTVMTLNGNSGSGARFAQGEGSGTPASYAVVFIGASADPNVSANTFSNGQVYIPNYTNSKTKPAFADNRVENFSSADSRQQMSGLIYNAPTSAITTITLTPNTAGNFVQHSTATLYGILNA